MEDRLPRKLAAILYADVANYSRLTGEDEDATHRTLSEYLDLIASTIESHRGQVMHYAGDAVLAQFTAVLDALSSAVAVQSELQVRNETLPDECKVRFRIGVNSGDVIEDRGDIYGDGVNVAARLESLAEPGGICISESVRTAVGKKLNLGYDFMGEQKVKNIDEPVRPFRVVMEERSRSGVTPSEHSKKPLSRPSIAVLPFSNLSSDSAQTFLSDGIAEDIIAELSRFQTLSVLGRYSSFRYRDVSRDLKTIGQELCVQYLVEGSVRRSVGHARISAQLIEAETGHHVWADRYDSELGDIAVVQDEIVHKIVSTLVGRLDVKEHERIRHRETASLDAYELRLQGREIWFQFTKESNCQARRLYRKALELDPNYSRAYVSLAWTYVNEVRYGWAESPDKCFQKAFDSAQCALVLDYSSHTVHHVLSWIYFYRHEYELAENELERAIELNPNDTDLLVHRGSLLGGLGKISEGIQQIKEGMRLNPLYPDWYVWVLGNLYYNARDYKDAIAALSSVSYPEARKILAAAYAQEGRGSEARTEAEKYLKVNPEFSVNRLLKYLPYKDKRLCHHLADGLRKAGFPE